MSKEPTAVVVGAGIIGAAIALELSRNGYTVTVVDAGPGPGTGSTSASSAIVRYHYANFDEAANQWRVQVVTKDGKSETLRANALISAVGQLNRPKMPDIPGQ